MTDTASPRVPTRYGFLGPAGTFTEAALLSVPGARDAERVPYESVPAALDAVRRDEVAGAVVAFENLSRRSAGNA